MSFGVSIGDILKVYETARGVYKKCRDCPGEYKTLASEARQLTNVLQDIADKVEADQIPEGKIQRLFDVYEGCLEVLKELDGVLNHYNSLDSKSKRAWDRLKWDSEKSKSMREKLTASVAMLNAFWQSLIHDNQVLILEALGRLERDYAGGHREESIASVQSLASRASMVGSDSDLEDEEDDAAWPQIIRDLEDVGVSERDALEYRDFIIDWFVRAVNEGRLLEKSVDQTVMDSTPIDSFAGELALALPESPERRASNELMPTWESPSFPPRIKRKPVSKTPTSHQSSPGQRPPSISREEAWSPLLHESSQDHPLETSTNRFLTSPNAETHSHEDRRADVFLSNSTSPLPEPVSASSSITQPLTPQISLCPPPGNQALPSMSPPPPPGMEYYTALRPVASSPNLSISSSAVVNRVGVPEIQPPLVPLPPAYNQPQTSTANDSNLIWTAQCIVAAWNERNFAVAEKHLEAQLAAVERGETITLLHTPVCPDRRFLQHLIGVCASFGGNLIKAKRFFQLAFQAVYLVGNAMSDGDIAAARWLGDTCLQMNEPMNAALAWSVALEGLVIRYGIARDVTQRVKEELQMLETRLRPLGNLERSFRAYNTDASDVFMGTPTINKAQLVTGIIERMRLIPSHGYSAEAARQRFRPRIDWRLSEGFLVQPLMVTTNSAPLSYDPFFCPSETVTLQTRLSGAGNQYDSSYSTAHGFWYDKPMTMALGQSKTLDFATRRDVKWLVASLKEGLKDMGIEHQEKPHSILCRISNRRENIALSEGIEIKIRKLQFRSVWGIKVSGVLHWTRGVPTSSATTGLWIEFKQDSEGFREIVKGVMERAEAAERVKESKGVTSAEALAVEDPSSRKHSSEKISYA